MLRQPITTEKRLRSLVDRLSAGFRRWQHLKDCGGQDPFWPDGVNMNLVRNHITVARQEIRTFCDENGTELPEEYHREPPEEVDKDYMANADEIRQMAKAALDEYRQDEAFKKLRAIAGRLRPKQQEKISIHNVLNYVNGLEKAIEGDDLITMRRHRNNKTYLESFAQCLARAEVALAEGKEEKGQMDIFSVI